MNATIQKQTADHQAPAHEAAWPAPPTTATRPEPDATPPHLAVARFLLNGEENSKHGFEDLSDCAAPVRQYLNKMNLADQLWIGGPLLSGLVRSEARLHPHHFIIRDPRIHREYPDVYENEASRLGVALEFLAEATEELRDFLTENDYLNNRLVSAVAGAIRSEIGRLVAFIDEGCPAELEDEMPAAPAPRLTEEPPMASPEEFPGSAANLLRATSHLSGRKGRPAELLDQVLRLSNYHTQEADLGLDCPAVTDFARQVVFLAPGLRQDERALRLARAVAGIRLVAHTQNMDGAEARRREDLYARLLLLPDAQVHDYLATLPPEWSERALLKAVATEFCVPKRVVKLRFQELRDKAA